MRTEKDIWCMKIDTEWCSTDRGRAPTHRDKSIRLTCGNYVSLPKEKQKRRPTCKECLRQLIAQSKPKKVRPTRDPIERFWEKVNRTQSTAECWPWRAARTRFGYGVYRIGRKADKTAQNVLAHRFAYEVTKDKIPLQMEVLHKCDNPPCCNPDHLFIGTQADNMADMMAKKRHSTQKATNGADDEQR